MGKKENQQQTVTDGTQEKMHEGEIHIDIALVRRLLREQFPEFAEKPLSIVRSTGTVNAMYRLGEDLCVRLPRLERWADGIDNEWAWLPKLAPHISLDTPKPIALGKPAQGYPCAWAVYEWIEGDPYQEDLIDDERQAAADLVNFVLELRSADQQGAPRGGRRLLKELDADTRSAIEASHGVIDAEAASAAWARSMEALHGMESRYGSMGIC